MTVDVTLTERNIVLVAHVLAAILTLGPVNFAASAFPRFVLGGDLAMARSLHAVTRQYGTGTILVPALGLYLATRMDYLGMLWVNLSLVLMVIALFLLFLAVIPTQQRLVASMADDDFTASASDLGPLRMTTGLFGIAWLVILYLMVAKPM